MSIENLILALKNGRNFLELQQAVEGQDLRLYLQQLLDQHHIDDSVFTTLYRLSEIAAYFTQIEIVSLESLKSQLKLDDVKLQAMNYDLNAQKYPALEMPVKIFVDDATVAKNLYNYLSNILISLETANDVKLSDFTCLNIQWLKKVIKYLSMSEDLKQFLIELDKAISAWSFDGTFITSFNVERLKIILYLISTAARGGWTFDFTKMTLFTNIMQFDEHPAMTYHYDPVRKKWFYIFLSQLALSTYHKTLGKLPIHFKLVFEKLSPLQIVNQRLKDERYGNLAQFTTKPYQGKVHEQEVQDFEVATHDVYHYIILAHLPEMINNLIKDWIKLLRKETGVEINKAIWNLTDAELVRFIAPQNPNAILDFFLLDLLHSPNANRVIEDCIILTHLIINNKFPADQTNQRWKSPWYIVLNENSEISEQVVCAYNKIKDKNNRFLIASIVFFLIINNKTTGIKCAAEFTKRAAIKFDRKWEVIKEQGKYKNMMHLYISLDGSTYTNIKNMITPNFNASQNSNAIARPQSAISTNLMRN